MDDVSNFSNCWNRSICRFECREYGNMVENHLQDLYEFKRECTWNTTVLPLTVFISILMVAGTVGNSLVIAVLSQIPAALSMSSPRGTAGVLHGRLVLALAVTDLSVCLVMMPGQLVRTWYLPWHYDYLCKGWELFRTAMLPVSAVILVAIARNRWRLIAKPTKRLSPAQSRREFVLTLVLAGVMGVAFGVPFMLSVGVYKRSADGSGERYYLGLCHANDLIVSQSSFTIYWNVLVFFFIMVLCLLLCAYTGILIRVHKQAKFWNRSGKSKATLKSSAVRISPATRKKKISFWTQRGKVSPVTQCVNTPKVELKNEQRIMRPELSLKSLSFNPDTSSHGEKSDCLTADQRLKQGRRGGEGKDKTFSTQNKIVEGFSIRKSFLMGDNSPDSGSNGAVMNTRTKILSHSTSQKENPTSMSTQRNSEKRNKRKRSTQFLSDQIISIDNGTSSDFSEPLPLLRPPQRLPHLTSKLSLPLPPEERQPDHSQQPARTSNEERTKPRTTLPSQPTLPTVSQAVANNRLKTPTPDEQDKCSVRRLSSRAEVKTAVMFLLVTANFLISYMPTFLMIVNVVASHPVWYYSYLIHAAVNPLLYSVANRNFRTSVKKLFRCACR